jgi:uncharacterized protein (TIGR00299 family) protein
MSRVLYWDPFSGIAGDMIVAALLDLGVPWEAVAEAVAAMNVPGLAVAHERVIRHGIAAERFIVEWERPAHPRHRHLSDILALLEASGLSEGVRSRAATAFRYLAEAEAAVHGASVEAVHLHEVGAEDSIADIVAASAAFETLGVSRCQVGPINLGSGWATGAHGWIPVPGPATLALLKGYRVFQGDSAVELTTPTGAALLRAFGAVSVDGMPVLAVDRIGYGAGTRETERPNVVRAILGDNGDLLPRTAEIGG